MEPIAGDGRTSAGEPLNVGARVARVWDHTIALLRLRLRQAQGDARSAGRNLLMGVVFGAVALVLFLLTLPLLVTAAILALSAAMPGWLAVLVVVLILLLVVAGLLIMARARLRRPELSLLRDLRADWQDIRQKMREGR